MYHGVGRVLKSNGGLFTVRLYRVGSSYREPGAVPQPLDGETVCARGRGALRRRGELLAGDLVDVTYDETAFSCAEDGSLRLSPEGAGMAIERVKDRSSALIRPPLANADVMFVTLSVTSPAPDPETTDKLISIAEYHGMEPVVVVTKGDLDPAGAAALRDLYRRAGFCAFLTGEAGEDDGKALKTYVDTRLHGKIAAFSGASGVGKSTLINRLFPGLHLETGEISRRIERGKNTTRCAQLYPLSEEDDCGFLADTPGFSMLDFERFDFFSLDDLPGTFREFAPYVTECRYTGCTHTKEEGCAVLAAVSAGKIAPSRHASFLSLYATLKKKPRW